MQRAFNPALLVRIGFTTNEDRQRRFRLLNVAPDLLAVDVKVHIEYGFAGIRRLDLEAYTGNDGKVKFTGLPSRVHKPPLVFKASKDALSGTAVYNPESECKAEHEIALTRRAQVQN